ncbi:MAG: hypothetical protein OEX98_09805 [Nitrosopumilus sp.]|nr:hypothetical protein [Nitrosopumilus sp.]
MITRKDVWISIILGIGSLMVSVGVIGVKKFFVSILFFIIPFTVIVILFVVFKPKNLERHHGKKL